MKHGTPTASAAFKHARALATAFLEQGSLMARVESRMGELAGERLDDPGAQMVHEHLATGGKRLRARLALAACQALGGSAKDAIDWAAAVELLHNASLVHDDIQDGDRTRRGKPALWVTHGAAQAINTGDLLLMLPFRALADYSAETQASLVQILASYAERTARGQIRELRLTASAERVWGDYLAAVSGKTGTLFGLPVRGAATLAGIETDEADAIASAFASIGVLYQLQDDLLDLYDAKGRGSQASDIYEGRLSAVVLTHLDLHPEEADSLFAILSKPRAETRVDEVSWLISRFVDGGAAQQLLERIELLASELLASDALGASSNIRAVAEQLVHLVLAPLQTLKGPAHE